MHPLCFHTLFCNLSYNLWRGMLFSEAFSKYALVCTCMCQFTFMSGSCWRLVRYWLKHDISLRPLRSEEFYAMCCYLCIYFILCKILLNVIFLRPIKSFYLFFSSTMN